VTVLLIECYYYLSVSLLFSNHQRVIPNIKYPFKNGERFCIRNVITVKKTMFAVALGNITLHHCSASWQKPKSNSNKSYSHVVCWRDWRHVKERVSVRIKSKLSYWVVVLKFISIISSYWMANDNIVHLKPV